ncbi:MAG: C-terminal helicase domain-containing protein, partial [Bacteroidales bacterium]|nr:C-terminal helicase domain-containing protein [Bacteroidales bacterium]
KGVPGSGIVYVRNRSKAEELSSFLRQQGVPASFYHAGLGAAIRTLRQEEWTSGKTRVIVSTNAFGMGIDKADVRFVVHYDLPESPEAYFQEAGRAGRDGAHSWAVLLWNDSDLRRLKQIESASFPSLEFIADIYQKIHIFSEIPYDTGIGREIKLDIKAFCRRFKFQLSPVYYAIKYLEREGHWSFSEDTDIKTRVMITAERTALYGIELPEPKMVSLLEVLMRSYTGLFSYPISIDEDYIAAKCGVSVPELRKLLYGLSINHVIRYIPADHSDILFILHDRLRPGNVQLSPQRYRLLQSKYRERVQAMTDYVQEEDECRSRFLLRYFGQENGKDCGRCDICRSKKKRPLRERILDFVRSSGGEYTLEELRRTLGPGEDGYLVELREMIDRGEVPPYRK